MSRIAITWRLMVVLSLFSAVSITQADEPVADWQFVDNAANEQVSGNVFASRPGLHLAPVDGPDGQAAYFAEGQYLVGKLPAELKPPMTMSFYVLPTGNPRGSVAGMFQQMQYGHAGFRIGYQRNGQVCFLYEGGGKEHVVRSQSELEHHRWHHVALNITADEVSIYINGKLDQTGKLACPITPTSEPVMIGNYSGTGGTFNGLLGRITITQGLASSFTEQAQSVAAANASLDLQKLLPQKPAVEPESISEQWVSKNLIFALRFNGDVSATTPAGVVEALDVNPFNLEQGELVDGVVGQALAIKRYKFLKYPKPANFPPAEGGTISLWFKPGDWYTPDAIAFVKKNTYAKRKMIFTVDKAKGSPWGPWEAAVQLLGDPADQLAQVRIQLGDAFGLETKQKLDPEKWYHLCATWGRDGGDPSKTRGILYLNGKQVDVLLNTKIPTSAIDQHLIISTTNPGVTYSG
ncbi:MAG: LamG-like jellyroll fold domain-containing protein, partial [Phycisphaeraceae bacterium JB051]